MVKLFSKFAFVNLLCIVSQSFFQTATDVNVTHQDFKQNVEQHNPEAMVEDTKEPQGGGVQTAPGDAEYQGK